MLFGSLLGPYYGALINVCALVVNYLKNDFDFVTCTYGSITTEVYTINMI